MAEKSDRADLDRIKQGNIGAMGAAQPAEGIRGYIQNMDLDPEESPLVYIREAMDFYFRPVPVREAITAAYESMGVIGMSHEYKPYSHTANVQFSFDIYVNALMIIKNAAMTNPRIKNPTGGFAANPEGSADQLRSVADALEEGRRYLEALMYPAADATGQGKLSPPFCILCIPGIVSLRCKLISLAIEYLDSDIRGYHKEFRATVTFEEHPQNRITMQDVLSAGMFNDMR
jgi:hypothetical protein